MTTENIADASKPNAGRMYDYYLGGNHNFEVDRQAADQVLALLPFTKKYVRLQRWALQDIAIELTQKRGYDVLIDFASGLPTEDHIHHNVPEGTTVIYSDYDPITVEYAREILGERSNVYFFESDAAKPEALLDNPQVQQILAGRKNVAFLLWGVSAFLNDEELTHTIRYLYEWSDPDSCLAFNIQGINHEDPTTQKVLEIYRKLGAPLHIRTPAECEELIQPWRIDGEGFISLLEWHNFDSSELGQEDIKSFGPLGGGHGAFLVK